MKRKVLFVLTFVFGMSGLAFAQTKTVTNADLEKYRQKRLNAEREYRENYRELGFPSPEELEKRNEQSQRELSELSQRLREEKLEKESQEKAVVYYQNDQDQNQYSPQNQYPNPGFIDYSQYGSSTYIYPGFYGRRFYNQNNRRNFYQGRSIFRSGRISPDVRNNSNRPAIRSDRRLNRITRIQTQRGNRNLILGVGVVRNGN